jgi:hypothetical protein
MESFRSLIGMKPKEPKATDEEIFTEEITFLLEPHLNATVEELRNEIAETGGIYMGTSDDYVRLINRRLLKKFFKLAQTDSGLNKFMIPIMMYLRSARMKRGIQ